MSISKQLYNVNMKHTESVYVPVYSDPANPSTYQNKWEEHANEYVNEQILATLFPNTNAP
ncbi:hypothetical protein [Bacillus sp. JJ722]|uniref:hypothetical protein n=1 Tax=Bacillus sp. JJ722 TaxID=3122973 RepID=UPI003000DB1B